VPAALCLLAALALPAWAARPLNTDDANIVDEKACQLESWVRSSRDGHEQWALAGCNPLGGAEFSLGGSRLHADTAHARATLAQVKLQLHPLAGHGWGLALAAGTQSLRGAAGRERDDYLNLPWTVALGADRYLHLNAGWVRHRALHVARASWGAGGEWPLDGALIALGEAYGERGAPTRYQLGLRLWLLPQRMQLDATYGNTLHGRGGRWFSVGLRLLSPPFLP